MNPKRQKKSNSETPHYLKDSQWNIYDWQDETQYSHLKADDLTLFRWEFHRRRPEYRDLWLLEAHKESSSSDEDLIANLDLVVPVIHENLFGMPNPGNANPAELNYRDPQRGYQVYFSNEPEGVNDLPWIKLSLNLPEFAMLLDLSQEPIRKLFARLSKRENFNGKKKSSQRDVLFATRDESVQPRKKISASDWKPRILQNPKNPSEVLIIFNQGLPVGPQWDFVKKELTRRQKPLKLKNRRKRRTSWVTHLRVLDARECQVSYAEIGEVIFRCEDPYGANGQGQKAVEAAQQVRDHFPM